jgi:polyisoprenoid-binding protein YceI
MRRLATLVLAVCLASTAGLAARAQLPSIMRPTPKPKAPPVVLPKPSQDPAAAPAGVYMLDPAQTSVVLRVMHAGGFSYTVVRMTDVSGALSWNPADPAASQVNVKIGAQSVQTPAPGLADMLTGEDFLDAAHFPQDRFVSTAVQLTGPTTGEVTGALTLRGVTRPLTLTVQLIGAGQQMRGPVLGLHAEGAFKRSDFHLGPPSPVIGDEVQVVLDLEFARTR